MNDSYEFLSNVYNTNTTIWNISSQNGSKEEIVEGPPEEDIPLPIAVMFIIVGTLGNSLVCLAIYLDRKLQNLTNYFLLSLAVTDLMVSLLIIPGRLLTVRYDLEPSNFYLCFLNLIGDDFVAAASAIHICFISISRYFAIRNPFDRSSLTKRRVTMKIGLVWVISFLTIIPYMVSAILTNHPNERTYCAVLLSNFVFYDAIIFIEAFVIIIMVVAVVVSFILTTILLQELVKKQQENTASRSSGLVRTVGGKITADQPDKKGRQELQSETKAMRVIWFVSFVFIICMVPYACTALSYLFFPGITIPPILVYITAYLNYLSSVINPIIYTIFNKTFRNDFKNLILFRYKKDK